MKTRAGMRLVLLVCLLLALAVPACADVWLPSGLVEIESQAFMDSAWLKGACNIPEGVTTIGAQAFYGCSGLTSLTIPDTVTSIGAQAFCGCTGLTGTITIPDGCKVADNAFDNCPGLTVLSSSQETVDPSTLFKWSVSGGQVTITSYIGDKSITSVSVPAQIDGKPVTAIGSYAFSSSRYLTSISLPHTLTTINNHAFSYCTRLTEISLPASVTDIGRYAFYYCSSLSGTMQLIDADIPSNAFTGCKKLTVLSYTTLSDGTLSLSRVYGSQTAVKVPASCNGQIVTAIGREAFSMRTTLQQVELPKSITSIGQSAFYYCTALQYVTLPDGVTSIGASAFYNCTALESVRIPDSVVSVGSMAFYNCTSLYGTLYFVDATINSSAFSGCDGMDIWCFTTQSSGSLQLASCRSTATALVIPESIGSRSVTSMAPQAFYYCTAVETIALPDAFTAICDEAFYELDTLRSITIPAGVTSIGTGAFSGCTSLSSISIPSAVKTIGTQAFYNCTSMTSAFINSKSTFIGAYAFAGCSNLSAIHLPNGFTNVGNMAFNGTAWLRSEVSAIAIDVAAGCSSDYQRALLLHDWLIGNTAYDQSYTHYGPEGVLFHGLGVCNAYTLTYSMLLDAVGIENMTVTGTATDKGSGASGSHAWTLIKLNGSWYHVDATWDDPLPDGRERHTYFCLSDEEIAVDHQWNTANYPAASSSLSSASSVSTLSLEDETEDDTSAASVEEETGETTSEACQDDDDTPENSRDDNRKKDKKDKKNKKN